MSLAIVIHAQLSGCLLLLGLVLCRLPEAFRMSPRGPLAMLLVRALLTTTSYFPTYLK